MKKALVMGIMALGAVATSYGQGHIAFDNYDSSPYMPIAYGATHGALANHSVPDANVHADLLYTLGTAASASTDLGLSVAIDPTAIDAFGNSGYFKGGIASIPGYTSGSCTFQIEAWQTAGPNGGATYAQSNDRGISAAFTEASLATGSNPANFFAALPGPNGAPLLHIDIVPEPSILALSGIGLAALMLRRKK